MHEVDVVSKGRYDDSPLKVNGLILKMTIGKSKADVATQAKLPPKAKCGADWCSAAAKGMILQYPTHCTGLEGRSGSVADLFSLGRMHLSLKVHYQLNTPAHSGTFKLTRWHVGALHVHL